jgi:hypothetical protein
MMRICQSVGILHPDHLFELVSHRQLQDWIDFHSLEPWGTPVNDEDNARLVWGTVTAKGSKVSPADFMPQRGGIEVARVDPELYKAKARAMYAATTRGIGDA